MSALNRQTSMLDGVPTKRVMAMVASGLTGRGLSSLRDESQWHVALRLLLACRRPVIITGFYVEEAGACETDGPMGAAVLGRALERLGKSPLIATDWRCRSVVSAASAALRGPKVFVASKGRQLLSFGTDLLVFIERPGRARDGRYYNMRGLDITDSVEPLDDVVSLIGEVGCKAKVLGIGDGGNEAGMGNFLQDLALLLPEYGRGLSAVRSDAPVACDVSNWGAYGLVALMSCITGRFLLHDAGEELQMVMSMLDAGAVDGKTLERGPFVDGLHLSKNGEVISALGGLVRDCLKAAPSDEGVKFKDERSF